MKLLWNGGLVCLGWFLACANSLAEPAGRRILLVAGETAKVDTLGHHDYRGGVRCLEQLLKQTAGVETQWIDEGWPTDETIFEQVDSVVFYTDGGGKQAFLADEPRRRKIEELVSRGVGLVMIHQAVDFPVEAEALGKAWLGGIYAQGKSGRGHWPSVHVDFPQHPTTRGVEPWKIQDGWLNKIQFVDAMKGVTPLLWSGKEYAGSRAGLDDDIVAWAYERPDGGRSFSFTGLDAHSAWSLPGMRRFVVNGVLWSAKAELPEAGAPCQIDEAQLDGFLTPREPKPQPAKKAKAAKK
jgi:hypothetical protein